MEGPTVSHQGVFESLATLEAQGAVSGLGVWHATRSGVETGDDLVFFPGTAALLDPFFQRKAEYAAGPHAAILILNAVGLRPRIVGGGSGHDLYYTGRMEEFAALGERLKVTLEKAIAETGKGPVVCSSPEDVHALNDLHGVEAVHVSEYLCSLDIPLQDNDGDRPKVAFFDPCRLGRYRGVYDQPRQLLSQVVDVVELGHPRGEEPCCGVSSWVDCNSWSKDHREAILRGVHEAGVEVLVTACPMCQVHLDCYFNEEGYEADSPESVPPIRIVDLCELVANQGGLLEADRPRLSEMGQVDEDPGMEAGLLATIPRGPIEDWLDAEAVRATHLCTLCLRCVHECPQDAPVLDHVLRVRQGLHGSGRSPEGIASMVTSVSAAGNPFHEPSSQRTEAFPDSLASSVLADVPYDPEVLMFLGCVYSYQDPRALGAIGRVMEATGDAYAVLGEAEECCGYVDHLAGAEGEFEAIARDRIGQLRASGASVLVTPCSGCFRTLSQLYPEVDPEWPGEIEVLHLAEYLDRKVREGRMSFAEEGPVIMVAYHDPCDLGRQCNVYDAPRRLLAALPGVVVEEFPEHREGGRCCGGGGALRAYDASISVDLAVERLGTLVDGIDIIASGCPSCKGNLRLAASRRAQKGDGRLKVLDISEVVASRLMDGDAR
jgi:Fe-S oxidoreductase